MINVSDILSQVPYIPVSIQSNQGSTGIIQTFVGDFTVDPSFILNTSISFPGGGNNSQFYESGLTIAYEEDGSIVIVNSGDISIDSSIHFNPPNQSNGNPPAGNLTIISSNGNININQQVAAPGRITLLAPQGTITIASGTNVANQNDKVIISAGAIQNYGTIQTSTDAILCSPQNNINNNNGATIQANRIIAQHINNNGSLTGDQIIADAFSPSEGGGTGTVNLTNSNLNPAGLNNVPNAQGISFNNNKVTVVTRQNVTIPSAITLNTDLEIVSTGTVLINNILTMPGQNLTIISNIINATSDIDVSSNMATGLGNGNIGSISLFALTNIATENLVADVICDGQPGKDVSNQTGDAGIDGTGEFGFFGGIGGPGSQAFAPGIAIGTPITVIAGGQIIVENIFANFSAQGGRGGNVTNCTGGQGAKGIGASGGRCAYFAGIPDALNSHHGGPGNAGGDGGPGGIGGPGGAGPENFCTGSHVTMIASAPIAITNISLTVNISGGTGGTVSNCTGGAGGDGTQAGWNAGPGGNGGQGGDTGYGGNGGNAGNAGTGGGQIGSVTILSCGSVTISNTLQCNGISNGGSGGSVSGNGGQGGDGGAGGGNCPVLTGNDFAGGNGGDGGNGGSAGQSLWNTFNSAGTGGDAANLNSASSLIIASGTIQISSIVQNQMIAGAGGTANGTPGGGGSGGANTGNPNPGSTGGGSGTTLHGSAGTNGTPSSIPMVLVSYESINVPDLINGTSSNVPFFQSLMGLAGSGSITVGSNLSQLNPIPAVSLLNQFVPISYSAQNTLDGAITVISPQEQFLLSAAFFPSDVLDYQIFNAVLTAFTNLALASTQNVHVESIQIPSFNAPTYLCPGASSTVTFSVSTQNVNNTVVAAPFFNNQPLPIINVIPNTTQSFPVTVPQIAGSYPVTLTAYDSSFQFCSDVASGTINVITVALSDVNIPPSVLVGSNFPVSFGANVQDPTTQNPNYQASVAFNNGVPVNFGLFLGSQIASTNLMAPCTPSDYTLTITASNPNIPGCPVSSDFIITVTQLTVEAQVSSRSIASGNPVTLSVSDPLPLVIYTWSGPNTSGSTGSTQTVTPPAGTTTTYTVQAQSGICSAQESISVSVSTILFSDHGSKKRTTVTSSDFTLSFHTVIQGGGSPSDVFASFDGSDYPLGVSDFYSYTFSAPCTPSDYNLVVNIQDTLGATANLDFKIIVKPFTATATVLPQLPVEPLQQVMLSASIDPALPNATYKWTSNTGATIQNSDTSIATSSPEFSTIYTVTVTNGSCSFSDSIVVRVQCSIELSDLIVTPNPVLAGSPITATFTPVVLNGNSDKATATLSIGSNSDLFIVSDNIQTSVSVLVPCFASDGSLLLSITAHDSGNPNCQISSDVMVQVNALTVTGLASPELIGASTSLVTLSISDLLSDVTYTWFDPLGETIAGLSPARSAIDATYVVTATNGICSASDSVRVAVSSIATPRLNAPLKICAGTTTDVSFQIHAENGHGRVKTVLSFSDQIIQTSDISTTLQLFFASIGTGNSEAGIYAADFIPLYNGPNNIQFMQVVSSTNNATTSMYVDAGNQKIYWVNSNNELFVGTIDITNPGGGIQTQQQIGSLDNAYGLFIDSANGKIYWVDSNANTIYVATISEDVIISSPTVLLSGQNNGVNVPTGFFLNTETNHVYWTNLGDNTLWVGTLDSLENPTQILSAHSLLASPSLPVGIVNQPRGVSVNHADRTIYWVNSANGGELWRASIFGSASTPVILQKPLLLSQGNFGTPNNPNTLLSGLCVIFPPASHSASITAPLVGGNYPLTLTVNDSDLSSNGATTIISVSSIALQDVVVPSAVLTGSPIDVMVTPMVTRGSGNNTAMVTLSLGGHTSTKIVSDNQPTILSIFAPCVASDTPQTLTITIQDPSNMNCSASSDVPIVIEAFNAQILTYILSDTLPYMSQTNTIISGQQIFLSVINPALTSDAYRWNTGAVGITISDFPETDFNYVVTTVNGHCRQSVSANIIVNQPQICVLLSDITVMVTTPDPRARFPAKFLTVTGYQFSLNSDTSRTVQLGYNTVNLSDTFDTDGQFSFSNIPFRGSNTLRLTAFVEGDPLCIPNVSDFFIPSSTKTFTISYIGSMLTPVFHLPPNLADIIHTSDINLIFSDMCAYANQQPCGRFVAGLEILENSDVLPSDSVILQGVHVAFIFCSDNDLYAEEIFQGFTFVTSAFASDNVTIKHTDLAHGATAKTMQRTGFSVESSSDKLKWWSPCDLNLAEVNVASMSNLINLPLLSVMGSSNPITDIEEIICLPICEGPTSDAQYVCQLCKCAQKMEVYLDTFYPNSSDFPISEKNRITYTGKIIANVISIDLEHCMICFSDFLIPDCSDTICF